LKRAFCCPPESGGQYDRDAVEIVRGVVPKRHCDKWFLWNHPSRDPLRDPAALLTQEGISDLFKCNRTLIDSFSGEPVN